MQYHTAILSIIQPFYNRWPAKFLSWKNTCKTGLQIKTNRPDIQCKVLL